MLLCAVEKHLKFMIICKPQKNTFQIKLLYLSYRSYYYETLGDEGRSFNINEKNHIVCWGNYALIDKEGE